MDYYEARRRRAYNIEENKSSMIFMFYDQELFLMIKVKWSHKFKALT
jgi:hypothetical protein